MHFAAPLEGGAVEDKRVTRDSNEGGALCIAAHGRHCAHAHIEAMIVEVLLVQRDAQHHREDRHEGDEEELTGLGHGVTWEGISRVEPLLGTTCHMSTMPQKEGFVKQSG